MRTPSCNGTSFSLRIFIIITERKERENGDNLSGMSFHKLLKFIACCVSGFLS